MRRNWLLRHDCCIASECSEDDDVPDFYNACLYTESVAYDLAVHVGCSGAVALVGHARLTIPGALAWLCIYEIAALAALLEVLVAVGERRGINAMLQIVALITVLQPVCVHLARQWINRGKHWQHSVFVSGKVSTSLSILSTRRQNKTKQKTKKNKKIKNNKNKQKTSFQKKLHHV